VRKETLTMNTTLRKLTSGLLMAGLVAGCLAVGAARADAADNNKGGKKKDPCPTLLTAIKYAYIAPDIQAYLIEIYLAQGCDPSLLP
jgi:hypothetical protein